MMLHTTSARSWEWSPSAFSNSMVSLLLRTPLLHRAVSKQILLISFTGRKSGKHYTIPVGYVRSGQTVTILTKWFRGWWRNFMDAAPVELLIERKTYRGIAKALTDDETVVPLLTETITQYPYYANYYDIHLIAPNQPNMDDVRRIAPKVVAVQATLMEMIE